MGLTKEQLLIPRVMCVGGKEGEPNDTSGDFITGDILTQTEKRFSKWKSSKLKHTVYLDTSFIEKFPHLFRPMPWWEGRKPEDMPEYVVFNNDSLAVYYKVTTWDKISENIWQFVLNDSRKFSYDMTVWGSTISPATEQEYNEYIKQKEAL